MRGEPQVGLRFVDLDRFQWGRSANRALKGVEYIAKYNLGHDVPYTAYRNSDVTQQQQHHF